MALRIADKAALTDVGRQRQSNEDSYLEREPLFAVADGMGGARAGEVASRMAVEAFGETGREGDKPEELLRDVATEANRRIYEMAQSDSEHAGMGTTLTAALVDGRDVAVGHVGDSRLYRFRDGALERLTEDHSLVEELVRQGRLTPEEAETHPQRSIITRALGPEPSVEVETFTDVARAGDVYLICSDGLSGMVPEQEMAAILRGGGPLADAAEGLVDAANRNGGKDNITVILFRLEADGDDEPSQATSEHAAVDAATTAIPAAEAEAERARLAEERGRAEPAEETEGRRAVRMLPPTREDPGPRRRTGRRRLRRRLGVLLALLALAAAIVGIWAGTQQFYFLGTDDRGVVTLYRGVPYELPFGIDLYSKEFSSDVPASAIEDKHQRDNLLDHKLRSHGDAVTRLRELERAETPR
ncbi:MAG: Stp1/IreP family PP2C-type Ser/Thr phosphatase [Thermoleophilaceae bacterium]